MLEGKWRDDGVKVIPADSLDTATSQTPGMDRAAAITFARAGAQKLWAGTVRIHPGAKTGAHHHGALESVIYIVRGRARMRWGDALEYTAEAGPGDFIFVPPYVPHQEIYAAADEPLECVLVRSDGEAIVVNLDIEAAEATDRGPLDRPDPPLSDGLAKHGGTAAFGRGPGMAGRFAGNRRRHVRHSDFGAVFGMSEQLAQGTSLVMVVPNVAIGLWNYARRSHLDKRIAFALAARPFRSPSAAHVADPCCPAPAALRVRVLHAVHRRLSPRFARSLPRSRRAPVSSASVACCSCRRCGRRRALGPLRGRRRNFRGAADVLAVRPDQAAAQGYGLALVAPGRWPGSRPMDLPATLTGRAACRSPSADSLPCRTASVRPCHARAGVTADVLRSHGGWGARALSRSG